MIEAWHDATGELDPSAPDFSRLGLGKLPQPTCQPFTLSVVTIHFFVYLFFYLAYNNTRLFVFCLILVTANQSELTINVDMCCVLP